MVILIAILTMSGIASANPDSFPLDKYRGQDSLLKFPDFFRKDIPNLLKVAASTETVTDCPANGVSSRYVASVLRARWPFGP